MSAVRAGDPVVAILCSDIHLTLKPPIARSDEPDWRAAMQRPLDQISNLQEVHNAPVICAGDLFDRWNAPAELINFALTRLPEILAIPGQHDLPLHRLDLIERSAFTSLVLADRIRMLGSHKRIRVNQWLDVWGFPYGEPIQPLREEIPGHYQVAVIHQYLWTPGHSHPKAQRSSSLFSNRKSLQGYDLVVAGDNHQAWEEELDDGPVVYNCGSLLRRRADEIEHKPRVGVLYASGHLQSFLLDISEDHIADTREILTESKEDPELSDFIDSLLDLSKSKFDFRDSMEEVLDRLDAHPLVRAAILEAME